MQIQSVRNPNAIHEVCKGFVRRKNLNLMLAMRFSVWALTAQEVQKLRAEYLLRALTTDINTARWALIVRFSPATLTTHNNPQSMSQCMLAENCEIIYATMSYNELGIELATGSIRQSLYWVQLIRALPRSYLTYCLSDSNVQS
jgi:hypothetical protein